MRQLLSFGVTVPSVEHFIGRMPLTQSRLQNPAASLPSGLSMPPVRQQLDNMVPFYLPPMVQKRQVALSVLQQLESILQEKRALEECDLSWLKLLQQYLGQETLMIPIQTGVPHPLTLDTRLTLARLQEAPKNLERLRDTLRVFLLSNQEIPVQKQLGSLRLLVHNVPVAGKLRAQYTLPQFLDLFELCRAQGAFDLTVNPNNGLTKTSGIQSSDDSFMGRLQWVTDVVYAGDILRETAPEAWKKSLKTLVTFYLSEKPVFEKIIQNPAIYHMGDPIEGVAHIFNPETYTRAEAWEDYLRLDSHGLAMKALADTIFEGTVRHQPWGLQPAEVEPELLQVLVYLAHYCQAIGYASARSSGPWEEIPFPGGLSSSVEAVRAGYEALDRLLFSPNIPYQAGLDQLRGRLHETERQICQSLGQAPFFDRPQVLANLLQQGREKLVQNLVKHPLPAESPGFREADASLAFITASSLQLAPTPLEDIMAHLRILDFLEQRLVRAHGMIRYAPFQLWMSDGKGVSVFDSYLGPNGSLLANEKGYLLFNFPELLQAVYRQVNPGSTGLDCGAVGDTAGFIARGAFSQPGKEAEWFMVSDMAKGYGVQLEKLLQYLQQKGQRPTPIEVKLLQTLYQKEVDFLNRSYARITGVGKILANGRICPAFRVPEAYQYVSTVNPVSGLSENLIPLPGGNTPLSWATASLYGASKLFLKNLITLRESRLMQVLGNDDSVG